MSSSRPHPPPPPSPIHILRTHKAQLSTVYISHDNERIYAGDISGLVSITSTRTWRAIACWKAHTDGLLGVQEWEEAGCFISHGRDNKLHVWARVLLPSILNDSAIAPELPVPELKYSMDVNSLNFCRFSLFRGPLEGGQPTALMALPNLIDSSVADIWTLPSIDRLHGAVGRCGDPDWQPDGRGKTKTGILMSLHLFSKPHPSTSDNTQLHLLTAYESGSVTLWAYTNTERIKSVEGRGWDAVWSAKLHAESVMSMAASPDSTVAFSTSADHVIGRYNLSASEFVNEEDVAVKHRIKQVGNASVAIRDDGRVCAIGGWDGKIRLFSTKTLKPLGSLAYHTGTCHTIAFAHTPSSSEVEDDDDEMTEEGKKARSRWLVAGGQDQRISVWELMSFEKTGT